MKKSFATVWLDGCSGCHMSFLDIDEKLLKVLQHFDIVYSPLVDVKDFPENVFLTLIEGAVASKDDIHKIKKIRKNTTHLVSIGDCAVTGNVPSMRNPFELNDVLARSYTENADLNIDNFPDPSRLLKNVLPVHEVVKVDFFLPGCPPPPDAIYSFILAMMENKPLDITSYTRFGK